MGSDRNGCNFSYFFLSKSRHYFGRLLAVKPRVNPTSRKFYLMHGNLTRNHSSQRKRCTRFSECLLQLVSCWTRLSDQQCFLACKLTNQQRLSPYDIKAWSERGPPTGIDFPIIGDAERIDQGLKRFAELVRAVVRRGGSLGAHLLQNGRHGRATYFLKRES